jgi:hypothetical protein
MREVTTAELGYTRDARSQPCNGAYDRDSRSEATTVTDRAEARQRSTTPVGAVPGSGTVGPLSRREHDRGLRLARWQRIV